MLIPAAMQEDVFSSVLGKTFNMWAKGWLVIGRNLKATSGHHFSQELHIENLEVDREILKVMELDETFHQEILKKMINNALDQVLLAYESQHGNKI